MKTKILLLFCLFMGLIITQISAQENTKKIAITGTVMDADSSPVANATVMIDGQKTNALTNAKGQYKIKVKPDAVRIGLVSFAHGLIEEDIEGRTLIDFNYNNATQAEEIEPAVIVPEKEVVNTGYNSVRKENLTTSISKIDKVSSKRTYATIFDMIQEVPGVRVHGKEIVIQDAKNLYGNIPPLFVVDGVPVTSIDGISPVTVQSIEVLKGTSAAIYGSRGYGGAILIKTKIAY